MNKIEKMVYDKVKSNQKLKNRIRNIYQGCFDLLPSKPNYSINPIIEKRGYFFGFHDITPFSSDEKYILANKLDIPLRMPSRDDFITVGYWNSKFTKFYEVGKTHAWNYHKGCRLQWLGEKSDEFIYNSIYNNMLCSLIFNVLTKTTRRINFPIDTVSPNGKYATSFSYERLNRYMPGYGYSYADNPHFEENASSKTGLFIIDIEKNTMSLIISLKELSQFEPDESMNNKFHFVTHTEFSPDGQRVAFLHRWTDGDPDTRMSRLITCNLDGTDICVSKTTGMVSHYAWNKNCGIIAYCRVGEDDGHYLFSDYTLKNPIRVAKTINSDGHQTIDPNGQFFITDTYPDRRRHAKLYKVDLETDKTQVLVDLQSPKEFQSPSAYQHWACDLHPRLSPLGTYVSFDSVHNGERALCVMEL